MSKSMFKNLKFEKLSVEMKKLNANKLKIKCLTN